LNEPAAHILHDVPTGETYEEVTEVLENSYSDYHLAGAFHFELKRIQLIREYLQQFTTTTSHLAHRAHDEVPEHLITQEAARSFADEIRERDRRRQSWRARRY
jgi:hypothetical protein